MLNLDKINISADFLNRITKNFEPEIAIILGSGWGDFADEFNGQSVKYSDIPNFEVSKVQGHKGQLLFAEIFGKKVVIMQGRFHFYEGHSIQKTVFPIAVLRKLGVEKIIITNAAGGANETFSAGDLMLITDHINFMGTNPLIGDNSINMGERFPDMSEVYDKELRELVKKCAQKTNIDLKEGVYLATTGPSFETPAEIKMFKTMGADAVGMSTVPEAIFANYCGMKVIGISCISNLAAGIGNTKLAHEDVIQTANVAKEKIQILLKEIIKSI